MFTFSVKLEKWSFHVADFPRTGKKCTEMKKVRERRANLLFCLRVMKGGGGPNPISQKIVFF